MSFEGDGVNIFMWGGGSINGKVIYIRMIGELSTSTYVGYMYVVSYAQCSQDRTYGSTNRKIDTRILGLQWWGDLSGNIAAIYIPTLLEKRRKAVR